MPTLWGAFLLSRTWLEGLTPTGSHHGLWSCLILFIAVTQSSHQLYFMCPKVLPPQVYAQTTQQEQAGVQRKFWVLPPGQKGTSTICIYPVGQAQSCHT